MRNETPQIVVMTLENNINIENIEYYQPLFENFVNPNGCPIRGTFFVQDDGSDYSLIRSLYTQGHEIGINSETGVAPTTAPEWTEMIKGLQAKLNGIGIDNKEIYGNRVPELACGGRSQFIGMGDNGILYDSTMTSVTQSEPETFLWPYTYDYPPFPACDNGQAPDLPFPGLWEAPIADLHDLTADRLPCAVPSGCRNVTTKKDAFDLFFTAFQDHYNGNRAPFMMVIDPAWAKNQDFRDGTIEFVEYIRAAFTDVWIVPAIQMLQWVQNPVGLTDIDTFQPWQCS